MFISIVFMSWVTFADSETGTSAMPEPVLYDNVNSEPHAKDSYKDSLKKEFREWMEDMVNEKMEFRKEMEAEMDEFKKEMNELRDTKKEEMKEDLETLKQEQQAELDTFEWSTEDLEKMKAEQRTEMAEFSHELMEDIKMLKDEAMEEMKSIRDNAEGEKKEMFDRHMNEREDMRKQMMEYKNTVLDDFDENEAWDIAWDESFWNLLEYWEFVENDAEMKNLLKNKARLISEIKKMDWKMENLKKKIRHQKEKFNHLKERLEGYNFSWDFWTNAQQEYTDLTEQLEAWDFSDEEIKAKLEKFETSMENKISKSKEDKFKKGLIPFKDTDDNDWFTSFVMDAKKKWIVSGYKNDSGDLTWEFWPGNNVTIAEIMKMWAEATGIWQRDWDPSNDQAKNHWAKWYIKAAQDLGVSMANDATTNIDRKALRWEVLKLLMEMYGIDPSGTETSWFSDVSESDPLAPYIYKAKDLGIVSWYWGTDTFWINNDINRAEISKIISRFMEIANEK